MRDTVRELAYVGRYADASAVLDLLPETQASFIHTYRGFIARQTGDFATARIEYETAIALEPANFLARSYYGQGLVAIGDTAGAEAQLIAIRLGGGEGTWAEQSLAETLEGKPSPFY
jgi:Flp pilus assembly protein TadD